jgi:pectate lyase
LAICLLTFLYITGVVPEIQCAVKREAKKAQKDKDKPNSTTCGSSPESVGVRESESRVTSLTGSGPTGVISNGHSSTSAPPMRKVAIKVNNNNKAVNGNIYHTILKHPAFNFYHVHHDIRCYFI